MMELAEKKLKEKILTANAGLVYQRFNLHEDGKKLFEFLDKHAIDGIVCDKYFILHKNVMYKEKFTLVIGEYCYVINKKECKFINYELFNKHHLIIASCTVLPGPVDSNQKYRELTINFKNNIIDIQLDWTRKFLHIVYLHLNNRRSGKYTLVSKEIIQAMLGDVFIHIKTSLQYRENSNCSTADGITENQLLAVKEIKLANQLLAKLYGGRAFLSGNIIEMIMIFEYFRDIYFN